MFSFAIYTFMGCAFFILVIILIDYYFLIQTESVYLDTLTKGTEYSKQYKRNQIESLNKNDNIDGVETKPIKKAITEAVEYYND